MTPSSMLSRRFLAITFCLLGNSLALSKQAVSEQPNLIILLADDLGYGELGCQGNKQIPTPNIDSIAQDGIRFTQAYVTAPNCSPSRAGLLTGKIPTRFGYEFNPIGARNEDPGTGIPSSEITLAEMLHDQGYTTGLIGKWHLGGSADYHPFRHGFDEFFGFSHEGHYFVPPPYKGVTTMLRRKTIPGGGQGRWTGKNLIYTTHMGHDEPDYDANNPIVRGGQPVVESEYLTDALTREAVDFIDRHDDKPFFLMLAYNAVHSPLQGKDSDMKRFASIEDVHRRIFASMLAALDESVGSVLNQVRKSGLDQDTLVVFLSDNGGPTKELTSSNLPLRGQKGTMYEGGVRVPMMIRWPGKFDSGQVIDTPVSSTDIFATAAAISDTTLKHKIDGRDLSDLPKLDQSSERVFYWRQGHRAALRKGDWKLVNMKRQRSRTTWELYNLATDLEESNDLADKNPETLRSLIEIWESMDEEMKPALF